MMRNFGDIFSRSRGNPAGCVLRRTELERRAESGLAPELDDRVVSTLFAVQYFEFRVSDFRE
jgi:hypothetical protein